VKNNIIGASAHNAVKIESGVSMSTLAFDYNDYYNPALSLNFRWPASSGDFSAWEKNFLYDLHSRTENPEFISSVPSQPGDFSVSTSSPTIGAGVVLGATADTGLNSLSTWPGGIQLTTQGTAWNIGAFIVLQ